MTAMTLCGPAVHETQLWVPPRTMSTLVHWWCSCGYGGWAQAYSYEEAKEMALAAADRHRAGQPGEETRPQ